MAAPATGAAILATGHPNVPIPILFLHSRKRLD